MRVFHRTSTTTAEKILAKGFRDGSGTYMTTKAHRGVWLSSTPLDEGEGATGDCLLSLSIPATTFQQYEWVEEAKQYREALIPASIVNRFGPPRVHDHDLSGKSEKELQVLAASWSGKEGADCLKAIPFLRNHGLLGGEARRKRKAAAGGIVAGLPGASPGVRKGGLVAREKAPIAEVQVLRTLKEAAGHFGPTILSVLAPGMVPLIGAVGAGRSLFREYKSRLWCERTEATIATLGRTVHRLGTSLGLSEDGTIALLHRADVLEVLGTARDKLALARFQERLDHFVGVLESQSKGRESDLPNRLLLARAVLEMPDEAILILNDMAKSGEGTVLPLSIVSTDLVNALHKVDGFALVRAWDYLETAGFTVDGQHGWDDEVTFPAFGGPLAVVQKEPRMLTPLGWELVRLLRDKNSGDAGEPPARADGAHPQEPEQAPPA